ncbi:flagellar export chaperone FliS [Georgenia yuyongxinii]|uniref:Flagellar export chaperone FliS n=1 Tax=Georgenia yuyongxinii TaxID=2589797 RepID=A0A552WSN9_9MICO|nr:flagellar export chaperone FliS [Georgenia yuyongxinii]TRW45619.1 flagellar export chaperone FliS [Georgenia yuyongxinii]
MNQAALLGRFRAEAIATATPAQLLTMLYDRLVLDLDRGVEAIENGDRSTANEQLTHAQEIVHELRASLDVSAWDGAGGLMEVYGYLLTELVGANIARDTKRVTACRDLVVPLRDAWHEAAAMVTVNAAPTSGQTSAAGPPSEPARAGVFRDGAATGYQPLGDLGVA